MKTPLDTTKETLLPASASRNGRSHSLDAATGPLRTLQRDVSASARVRRLAAARRHANPADVVQRAPHRPDVGMRVRYNGQTWTVQVSSRENDQITIHRPPNHTQHLQWRTADFTILRANTNQDHDLRQGQNAYAAPGFASRRTDQIIQRFQDAKARALRMIKDTARPHVQSASRNALDAITLGDFSISQTGTTLIGPSREQAAEWKLSWTEGNPENPRRTWHFTIDADNPEPESSQEPHVGWECQATAGASSAVARVLGHIWLDFVPVSRGAL